MWWVTNLIRTTFP